MCSKAKSKKSFLKYLMAGGCLIDRKMRMHCDVCVYSQSSLVSVLSLSLADNIYDLMLQHKRKPALFFTFEH